MSELLIGCELASPSAPSLRTLTHSPELSRLTWLKVHAANKHASKRLWDTTFIRLLSIDLYRPIRERLRHTFKLGNETRQQDLLREIETHSTVFCNINSPLLDPVEHAPNHALDFPRRARVHVAGCS